MYITKTDGKKEKFSERKYIRSLRRAGADRQTARRLAEEVLAADGVRSTEELHRKTYRHLQKKFRPLAARYNLKRAIMQLGPDGYPFEKFISAVFSEMGYRTELNRVLTGHCVRHEVDVLAENDERKVFIECKYHLRPGLRSGVKVALYVKARFDDLYETLSRGSGGRKIQGLIVTNTHFSKDAERYAACVNGLGLISWRRPRGFSLAEMIDRVGLHPISVLTSLSRRQKEKLMREGTVLCRDIVRNPDVLKPLGISTKRAVRVVNECSAVCQLRNTL